MARSIGTSRRWFCAVVTVSSATARLMREPAGTSTTYVSPAKRHGEWASPMMTAPLASGAAWPTARAPVFLWWTRRAGRSPAICSGALQWSPPAWAIRISILIGKERRRSRHTTSVLPSSTVKLAVAGSTASDPAIRSSYVCPTNIVSAPERYPTEAAASPRSPTPDARAAESPAPPEHTPLSTTTFNALCATSKPIPGGSGRLAAQCAAPPTASGSSTTCTAAVSRCSVAATVCTASVNRNGTSCAWTPAPAGTSSE